MSIEYHGYTYYSWLHLLELYLLWLYLLWLYLLWTSSRMSVGTSGSRSLSTHTLLVGCSAPSGERAAPVRTWLG